LLPCAALLLLVSRYLDDRTQTATFFFACYTG
jgi:hypothetical protein